MPKMLIKDTLRVLRGKSQYLRWRLKSRRSRIQAAELYDVDRIYWIETARIRLSLDLPARDRLSEQDFQTVTPMLERGRIMDGEWDCRTIEFESQDVWHAFRHRFEYGKDWKETNFYKRVMRTIDAGIPMWSCVTKEQFDERLRGIEKLYHNIKESGYLTQDKIENNGYRPLGDEHEIQVHIGRNGEYIFADGRHRLCIAKLLGLEEVPVKIARRHTLWVELRKEILSYATNQSSRKIYSLLPHPDLQDIPSCHGKERWEMIKDSLPVRSGTVLDIGAHWGYFCHELERLGFECTAVEYLPINQYFLNRLREVEKRNFSIVPDSILSYDAQKEFSIVIALNVFHHFLKTEKEFRDLESLLQRLNMKAMVFEPHDPEEDQMKGSYKNFGPEEFVGWVQELCGFEVRKCLGITHDNRHVYLLQR